MRRVAITGMGWVTPMGHEIDGVWRRLLTGESGIAPTTIFDASTFPTTFAAEVKDFDFYRFFPRDPVYDEIGRNTRFALAAAKQAWEMSGLGAGASGGPVGAAAAAGVDPADIGVYLGNGEGAIDLDNFLHVLIAAWDSSLADDKDNPRGRVDTKRWAPVAFERFHGLRETEQEPNMTAAHLAILFDARGPQFNCLTACAASTQAIGEAARIIRRGDAKVMISGGSHSMIHPFGVTGFNLLTALSTYNTRPTCASRPFHRERGGFVLGEGAAIVILEDLEFARARGAKVLAEVVGYGSSADAYRITDIQPEGRGAAVAMRQALADAGLTVADVDYISAHGTGTKENDSIETLAIKAVFGDRARKVPVSSPKSMMGHLIAATGAMELITCVLAIRDNVVPPTMNLDLPDPECDLDYVPNKARELPVNVCLSNSFGFGGQNDTLVVRRWVG
jgi:3-oxoacyl-[acyl-carrier-protein] synthase II